MEENTIILDNGAYWAKVGLASNKEPRLVHNCVMKVKNERSRVYVGNQIDDCQDKSGLYYMQPFERGYITKWDFQKTTWDYMFSSECCNVDLTKNGVIVTEPYFNFRPIRELMTEVFFEDYEVPHLLRINGGNLSSFKYKKENPTSECCLVVDCGFSFSHVVPYVHGVKVKEAIKRIDIGGKFLTNYLKEVCSYRDLNVMEETYVVNQAKEEACYVSLDYNQDMLIAGKRGPDNTILRQYVLPNFTNRSKGFVHLPTDPKKIPRLERIEMNVERFVIPEFLFNPSDARVQQMGLPYLIQYCISQCPKNTWPDLYNNILLTGGCCRFPNFRERLLRDVRSLAPDEYDVNVTLPSDPVTYAWRGGAAMAKDVSYLKMRVSKAAYEEKGCHAVDKLFDVCELD